jgi:hypothetical protein
MIIRLFALSLAVVIVGSVAAEPKPRHSPYAPSLPYLTREEEGKIEQIINRFILADIGRLQGTEAGKARRAFDKLGDEAIPYLIRGLNRSAQIQHSCPVAVIARKLRRLLGASQDPILLEFARDEIGAGVGPTRHQVILDNLRFALLLRKNALARRGPQRGTVRIAPGGSSRSNPGEATLSRLSTEKLLERASIERGAALKQVLLELAKRRDPEVIDGFITAANSYEASTQQLGRVLLDRHLAREKDEVVKKKLGDEHKEVRLSAIRVVVGKYPNLAGDLIPLLADEEEAVRTLAHRALVRLSRGLDLGPAVNANTAQRELAQKRWQLWWARQQRR